jgi:hypothetical protein
MRYHVHGAEPGLIAALCDNGGLLVAKGRGDKLWRVVGDGTNR